MSKQRLRAVPGNMMIWRWTGILTSIVIILMVLSACTYSILEGNWVHINAPSVHFDGVRFSQNSVVVSGYKELCNEALDEIEMKLVSGLKKRLAPVSVSGPEKTGKDDIKAHLKVQIAKCDVESYQWDNWRGEPSFTYYMTLIINVTLKMKHEVVLDQTIKTSEQVYTDASGPLFEFTHRDAVVRVLAFFDKGKVWTPKEGKIKLVPAFEQSK